MKSRKQYIGEKFGKLLVIKPNGHYVYPNKIKTDPRWECLCDCGKTTTVRQSNLNSGNTRSCGCLVVEWMSNLGKTYGRNNAQSRMVDTVQQFWDAYIKIYQKGARSRNYDWSLCREDVIRIVGSDCHYCSAAPRPNFTTKQQYYAGARKHNCKVDEDYANTKVVNTNGIDRVDNTKGYTTDNVVPCCKLCNYAKSAMAVDEFESWILRAADHIKSRLNPR
jgi:hypothetical protein